MRRITTAAALLLAACLYPDIDSEQASAGESARRGRISVQHNRETFVSRVTLTAQNGRVAWEDVLRGVARVRGFDDQALEGTMPGSLKIEGYLAHVALSSANRLLGGDVMLYVIRPPRRDAEPRLVIELDDEALLASQRRVKERLRQSLLPDDYDRRDYGIHLHGKAATASDRDELVIFIHGLNSHPNTVRHLASIAEQNGLACAEFNYPNDQAIDASGRLLSAELRRWKKQHPRQRVALVTHSMGGLVARVALEDPQLDPGNVDRLIMVAPPNQGCALAQFAFGLDLWEYMDKGARDSRCLFYSSIEDGLSEATVDLQPGSIFLTKLNRRGRNPRVQYSIFLGTGGPCTHGELDEVRGRLAGMSRRCPWARCINSRLDPTIADLEEVVHGAGDGAVAVKRGRLADVKDTQVLGFGHLSVLYDTKNAEVKKLYDEVLKRLKDEPATQFVQR